ncbi:hypothetical protein D3C76_1387710 [compost metagenome]
MALPTIKVAFTIIGKLALRSKCLKMIPQLETPIARAASTYCISLSCRKFPRTRRAILIQLVKAKIIIIYLISELKIASTRIFRNRVGTEFMTSTNLINIVSTHPPK